MKKNSGFTLIELIVVIAILGILAGVAIPIYSGYINKANQAADNQLLGAVNTAFAAACLENDEDFNSVANNAPRLNYTENGPITGVTYKDSVDASFLKYFRGNEGTSLKYYKPGEINFVKGIGFSANGTAITIKYKVDNGTSTTYTFDVGGKEVIYTVDNSQIAAFENSTFGKNMTIGELLGEMGNMTGAVGAVVNDTTANGATHKILESIYGSNVDELLGLTADDSGHYDAEQMGNALVLAVAKGTAAFNNSAELIISNLSDVVADPIQSVAYASAAAAGNGEAVANMAMAYSMMLSYVNSSASENAKISLDDGTVVDARSYFTQQSSNLKNASGGTEAANAIMGMASVVFGSSDFETYLNSPQATTDLEGYLNAMKAINANESTLLTDNGALASGYDNPEIANILSMIFGG